MLVDVSCFVGDDCEKPGLTDTFENPILDVVSGDLKKFVGDRGRNLGFPGLCYDNFRSPLCTLKMQKGVEIPSFLGFSSKIVCSWIYSVVMTLQRSSLNFK